MREARDVTTCPDCGTHAKTLTGLAAHMRAAHKLSDKSAHARSLLVWSGEDTGALPGLPDLQGLVEEAAGVSDDAWAAFGRQVIEALARGKHLPKAGFERRVDSLLAPFVPAVVAHALGDEQASLVAPEFPIKKLRNAQSTNADALYRGTKAWALLEIKTHPGSFDLRQLMTYVNARKRGMTSLVADLKIIHAHTDTAARTGYWSLIGLVQQAAAELELGEAAPIEIVYLVPDDLKSQHVDLLIQHNVRTLNFSSIAQVDVGAHKDLWQVVLRLLKL